MGVASQLPPLEVYPFGSVKLNATTSKSLDQPAEGAKFFP